MEGLNEKESICSSIFNIKSNKNDKQLSFD